MAIGQKQIHNKIQQLNFRDCHAKITQVDSQSTLGNGVVVQVTGELSNAGQPMRRFTQTFVLASQSPKKYYVHNDIFRYQDYYSEDEIEENGRSELEEDPQEVETQQQQQQQQVEQQQVISQPPPQTIYYQSNVLTSGPTVLATNYQQPPPPLQQQQAPIVQQLNGLGHEEPINQLAQMPQSMAPALETVTVQSVPMHQPPQPEPLEEPIRQEPVVEQPLELEQDKDSFDVVAQEQLELTSNEPKTYANLFKSAGSVSGPPPISFASTIGGGGGSSSVNIISQSSNVSPPPAKFSQDSIINRYDPPLGATATQKPLAQRPIRGTWSHFFLLFFLSICVVSCV